MAQQVEHVLGKDEVTGSNPVSSSTTFKVAVFRTRNAAAFALSKLLHDTMVCF